MAHGDRGTGPGEAKKFVISNIPDVSDKEDYMIDIMEGELDKELESDDNICFLADVPDRCLIILKEEMGVADFKSEMSEVRMSDAILQGEEAVAHDSFIVLTSPRQDLSEYLLRNVVKSFFQREYGGEEDIVSNVIHVPSCNLAVMCFTSVEVTERVLQGEGYAIPIHDKNRGLDIQVEPFLKNFHGHIPFNGRFLYEVLACLNISISETEWKLLKPSILENYNDMQYKYDGEDVIVQGANALSIVDFIDKLRSQVIHHYQGVGDEMKIFLGSQYARDNLTPNKCRVEWIMEHGYLHIYGFDECEVNDFKSKALGIKIQFLATGFQNGLCAEDQKLYQLCTRRNNMVCISSDGSEMTFMGIQRQYVKKITRKISQTDEGTETVPSLDRTASFEFEISEVYHNYLLRHHKEELQEAFQNVERKDIKGSKKIVIYLTGQVGALRKAMSSMTAISRNVEEELKMCLKNFEERNTDFNSIDVFTHSA